MRRKREWPEAGAQNVEEAEQYQDKINNIFDHLSTLITPRHKNGPFANHTKFQKGHHQTVGQHWGSQYRCGTQNNQGLYSFISMAAFNGQGHRGGGPP